jgi:imidazoleglycerol-phosphate dehydratase
VPIPKQRSAPGPEAAEAQAEPDLRGPRPAPPRPRRGTVQRRTRETEVTVALDLDGSGRAQVETGLPFFDHMLESLAKHSLIDLKVIARGDLEVDGHHTVEDVGLCIGRALVDAIGDRAGMVRFGSATIPFDEALLRCAVDLSGRPALVYKVAAPAGRIGSFDVELAEVFFGAVANEGRMNLHLILEYGSNRHHIIEGCFKAFARALEHAVLIDPRRSDVASTKGRLD